MRVDVEHASTGVGLQNVALPFPEIVQEEMGQVLFVRKSRTNRRDGDGASGPGVGGSLGESSEAEKWAALRTVIEHMFCPRIMMLLNALSRVQRLTFINLGDLYWSVYG